jgi:chemosensory pili system protein ChpA (sensor histidine kinase/response regulator)
MRLHDRNDYTTLTWVKPEIDEILKQARLALEDHVENGLDPARLAACTNGLAQVHGALRMVELYGAAMVAEEMHALSGALVAGTVGDRDGAFSALMRGIMQLPDYLERLQSGFRDIPLVLLPLLNELRAARGEKGVPESMLFSPDLAVELPAQARGPALPLPPEQVRRRAEVASQLFQSALLRWLKDGDPAAARDLADVCQQLVEFTSAEPARRLFWVASALLDGAARGVFPVERSHQQALARTEREIRRLAQEGDAAFRTQPPLELTRQLLFFVAHAPLASGRLAEVAETFQLRAYLPSEREVEHARNAMAGHNRALLATVTNAIKDDLLRVKDALDLHMRSPGGVLDELGAQIETLDRVKETLGMLGLGVPQRVIRDQLATLHAIAGGHRGPDESALLDIAGALLYVEALLDDQVARLGEGEAVTEAPPSPLPAAEARAVLDGVAREALANFVAARACFVAFVETHWDHARLRPVAGLLAEVAGAVRMLEIPAMADLLTATARYTEEELIGRRRVPSGAQLDRLADALASLEYFLEAVRDRRPDPEQILDIARDSLAAIGYWPLPETPVAAKPMVSEAVPEPEPVAFEAAPEPEAMVSEAAPEPEPLAFEAPPRPVAEEIRAASPPVSGERLPGFDAASSEGIDAEIQEVFLEEFGEEIENLGRLLPAWAERLEQPELLRPIRRVFHTLKGSGRLVGAKGLGEFAWRVENMLNRVLDGTRPATPAVFALVEAATALLPDLRAALAGEVRHGDLEGLKAVADRIAAGEEATYVAPAPAEAAPAVVPMEAEPAEADPIEADLTEAVPAEAAVPVEAVPPSAVPVDLPVAAPEPPATVSRWPMRPEFEPVGEGVEFALDPVLLEILRPEVEGHLEVVEEWLAGLRDHGPQRVEERLLRSVHTMNGAFAMTEVSAITGVTAPLEGFLKRAMAAQQPVGDDAAMLVGQAVQAVRRTLDALAGEGARLPQFPALALALQGLRDALPEPGIPLSLGEESPLVAVDIGGFDTAALPDLQEEEAASPPPATTQLPLEVLAEMPLLPSIELAGSSDPLPPAPPPQDDREAEAAYAREQADLAAEARAEREAAEQAEREAAEQAEREAAEQAEREAAEQAEREAAEQAERETAEAQAERERIAGELARREAARREAEAVAAADAAEARPGLVFDPATVPDAGDPADPDVAMDTTDLDIDLLEIFLEESGDLLDHSDGLMARLRDAHQDRELITGLQRDLHTLKGGARMVGVWAIGELGHAMESLLEAVADGKRSLDASGIIVLERCFDRLQAMISRVTERKAIVQPNRLIAQVNALAQGLPLPDAIADGAGAGAAAAPVAAEAPRKPKLAELSRPIEDTLDDDDGGALRAAQEQVRIRADLLDKLVNYAGEVAIYRARLEQQLGAFRGNLNELEQTTSRIRDQLRRLEIETEAQIASRYQREEDEAKTFDPLELDRFSNQQQLTRSLAESTNDLGNLYDSLDELTRGYEALLLQQSRVSSDLQEGLMRTRMLPFESLVPRLRRVLRQACTDTGKQALLKVDGASGEMDRSVLDRMTAPIEHMLRNAVAHGLEAPDERRKAGKEQEGTVRIAVAREGSEVVLRISDDGRGLDRERIFAKAVERGLTTADAQLSDEQVHAFILESGFSTADEVSKLAGRGVGMDVVHSEIRQLGGTLQIRSTPGKGSEFTVRLPFTLAVTQAVFVKIGETRFAVPIASVQGVARIGRQELAEQEAGDRPLFRYAGEDYGIYDLGRLVGHAPASAEGSLQMPLLLARSGELRAAICVDQVLGSREIVVKPVGPQVSSVTGIFGATIMGDGSVVVILDVAPLARRFNALAAERVAEERPVAPAAAPLAERRVPYVMVVDDSITMRKVTGRVLERHSFEVGTAKDGVDAIEKMAERVPDLMLLDIEMPRMDGYELAQTMRGDPRLRDVPIIMITSRTGEKHRQRAFEIGVNRYLGKPYQEPELVRNVFELLSEVAARD